MPARRTLAGAAAAIRGLGVAPDQRIARLAEVRRIDNRANSLVMMPVDRIAPTPSRLNSRTRYDEASLEELAQSIREQGIIQPLVVRPIAPHEAGEWALTLNGQREAPECVLVVGNRRLKAAELAGLTEVPCIWRVTDADTAFLLNLIENVQRQELTNAERLRSIDILANLRTEDDQPLGVRELHRRTGIALGTISEWLRIGQKPTLREALAEERVDIARAMMLVRAPDDALSTLLDVAQGLSRDELQGQIATLRTAPEVRAKRTATTNQRRVMHIRHLLALIDEVDDALRQELALARARIDELLV